MLLFLEALTFGEIRFRFETPIGWNYSEIEFIVHEWLFDPFVRYILGK